MPGQSAYGGVRMVGLAMTVRSGLVNLSIYRLRCLLRNLTKAIEALLGNSLQSAASSWGLAY